MTGEGNMTKRIFDLSKSQWKKLLELLYDQTQVPTIMNEGMARAIYIAIDNAQDFEDDVRLVKKSNKTSKKPSPSVMP